jgi:TetR/AcrR family transcriptional regulator, lmrAB and yxaGH operons repressor
MAKGEVRDRMVSGTVRLLAEHGPPGASFGDVLAESGAPRGSTYHHFPGGKRELYVAALDLASNRALAVIEEVRGRPARVVVERFVAMWRSLLTTTELRSGCAVLAVAVAGEDAQVVDHAGEVFRAWRAHLASLLVDGGYRPAEAYAVAALTIASMEGAVAIARAEGDLEPFELTARSLVAALPRA